MEVKEERPQALPDRTGSEKWLHLSITYILEKNKQTNKTKQGQALKPLVQTYGSLGAHDIHGRCCFFLWTGKFNATATANPAGAV